MKGECDICHRHSEKYIRKYKGMKLCEKHLHQIKKYGNPLENSPRTIYDLNEIHKDYNNNCAYIDLYNNKFDVIAQAIIDMDDVEKIRYTKWRLSKQGYVINNSNTKKGGKTKFLHRIVLDTNKMVDHINNNKLDNRKSNLRNCNKSTNAMNVNKYKGVYKRQNGGFTAKIKINQKQIVLGLYYEEAEAYYARWYAETLLFKDFQCKDKKEPIILESRKNEIKEYVLKKVQRL